MALRTTLDSNRESQNFLQSSAKRDRGRFQMAMDHIVGSLVRIPLFAGLTTRQITEIARRVGRRAFRRGETITKEGQIGDGAYLILSGDACCKIRSGSRWLIEPVEPGSLVGELAMFIDHAYGTTVLAQGWVDCLKLERSTLYAQMCADPDLPARLAAVIRGRLARVAAEMKLVDMLLLRSIEQCQQPPPALLPPRARPIGAGAAAQR
jgi:signal-transduction protein with cAMP-binding, CBS, and nucleotidyltransferase domain